MIINITIGLLLMKMQLKKISIREFTTVFFENVRDPSFRVHPRYWIPIKDIEEKDQADWKHKWFGNSEYFEMLVAAFLNAR